VISHQQANGNLRLDYPTFTPLAQDQPQKSRYELESFDLPKETLAVKATAGKLESRCLKLSNVHLPK
jgi:hypothetical protein